MSRAISFEKFGICFYVDEESRALINPDEIIGKLQKTIKVAEKHILTLIAKEQIGNANVTIVNQFYRLNSLYKYFRGRAAECYDLLEKVDKLKDKNDFVRVYNVNFNTKTEGAYNCLAMIDAFFSRLEHFLITQNWTDTAPPLDHYSFFDI